MTPRHAGIPRARTALHFLLLCLLALSGAQAEAQLIVSTSPTITKSLFALGLGPHVFGVSNYCEYPPEVKVLPKVGTFLRPDPELIVRDWLTTHRGQSHNCRNASSRDPQRDCYHLECTRHGFLAC